MQPQEIPDDILNQGTTLYGVEEDSPEKEEEDYLKQGAQIYVPPAEEKRNETWGEYLTNFAGQLGMRVGEQAVGLIPDLTQIMAIPGKVREQALSKITPEFLKSRGIDFGQIDKGPMQYILENNAAMSEEFTTPKLREKTKEYFEGKYEPKDAKQRIAGNVVQDLTAAITTPEVAIPRMIGTSLFGNTMKEVMKQFGFGETAQEATKFGSMTAASLINPNLLTNYIRTNYNLGRASVPNSHQLDMNNTIRTYQRRINRWRNTIGSEQEMAQAEAAAAKAEEIIQRAQSNNNSTRVLDIFDQRRAINQDMQTYGRFYHELVEPLRINLNNYSRNFNPVFGNFMRNGDQSFAGQQVSRRLAQNIKDYTHLTPQTALGNSLLDLAQGKAASIGSLGVSFATVKAYEMAHRALLNPTIRNLYFRTMAQAANNNRAAFLRDFKILEKAILKENEKSSRKSEAPSEES